MNAIILANLLLFALQAQAVMSTYNAPPINEETSGTENEQMIESENEPTGSSETASANEENPLTVEDRQTTCLNNGGTTSPNPVESILCAFEIRVTAATDWVSDATCEEYEVRIGELFLGIANAARLRCLSPHSPLPCRSQPQSAVIAGTAEYSDFPPKCVAYQTQPIPLPAYGYISGCEGLSVPEAPAEFGFNSTIHFDSLVECQTAVDEVGGASNWCAGTFGSVQSTCEEVFRGEHGLGASAPLVEYREINGGGVCCHPNPP